jgi:hypothetical protein
MAEGLRIRHDTLRPDPGVAATTIVVCRDLTEPLNTPPPPYEPPGCGVCGMEPPGHSLLNEDGTLQRYKVRHVTIDTDGYALVSAGVWEGLSHDRYRYGFNLVNTISNPPTLRLNLNPNGNHAVVVEHKMQLPILTRE